MFGLTEASTRRRAVPVGRPIAASSGSSLVGESFMLKVTHVRLSALAPARATHDHRIDPPRSAATWSDSPPRPAPLRPVAWRARPLGPRPRTAAAGGELDGQSHAAAVRSSAALEADRGAGGRKPAVHLVDSRPSGCLAGRSPGGSTWPNAQASGSWSSATTAPS